MKAILLAIGGNEFHEEAVRLSVELSWRMKAKLSVLQIAHPTAFQGWKGLLKRLRNTLNTFEMSMAAVAFAEVSDQKNALKLLEQCYRPVGDDKSSSDKKYDLHLSAGNPEDEMVRYLDDHREVVLTVCDSLIIDPERLKKRIAIPLVTVRSKT